MLHDGRIMHPVRPDGDPMRLNPQAKGADALGRFVNIDGGIPVDSSEPGGRGDFRYSHAFRNLPVPPEILFGCGFHRALQLDGPGRFASNRKENGGEQQGSHLLLQFAESTPYLARRGPGCGGRIRGHFVIDVFGGHIGSMPLHLRPLAPADWPRVADIYAAGIATGDATFETQVPTWEVWDAGHHSVCRWVAVSSPKRDPTEVVVGWAALAPASSRPAYAGVYEVSVYVDPSAWGRGIGTQLLERLVVESEALGVWTLQAGIMAENETSIRLHRRCGFRVMGRRERPAKVAGIWRDTVVMERRSTTVGIG